MDEKAKDNPELEPLKSSNDDASDDSLFDGLMQSIGSNGLFQKRLNLIFNCIFVTLMTMPFLNLIMVMSVPEHRCHVPGRNADLYSLEEWQYKMLPKDVDLKTGIETISKCKMFANVTDGATTNCLHGYDYDTTWYATTAPSDNDWVCDSELHVTNTFVASRIGEIAGVFVFGQLGDKIGRKPVYYIALVLLVVGRTASVFTSHIYNIYIVAILVGSSATVSVFQTPLVIGMEVSAEDKRAQIAFIQCLAWVVGSCALPLLQWVIGDWKILMLATTLPSIGAFFVSGLMPESPRWLASRGRVEDTLKVLKYIATVNKTEIPANARDVLEKIASKKEKTFGIPSLFSSARLAKNTLAIIICWCVAALSYFSLFLNISRMAGNPFMNFFWQSLVELPGYILGRYFGNKYGRRWTHTACYIIAIALCGLIILCHGQAPWITTALTTGIKFMVTITFYLVWLQAMEIYPTCVRQTGTSIGGLIANIVGILGPYIVYLGTTIDARLPYAVLLGLASLGVLASCTLPETLHKKLPETLQDARDFGEGQIFWSFNKTEKIST